jgi:hypothetical protein
MPEYLGINPQPKDNLIGQDVADGCGNVLGLREYFVFEFGLIGAEGVHSCQRDEPSKARSALCKRDWL